MMTAQLPTPFAPDTDLADRATDCPSHSTMGGGLAVVYSKWLATPLGKMLAFAGEQGVIMLDFAEKVGFDAATVRVKNKLGDGVITPGENRHLLTLKSELEEYFAGQRRHFSVALDPHGTAFERRAWEYLRTIPFAQTRSYGQQARAIGNSNASRAAGAANGRNDISILIPCHRVIGAGGSLVGYGGGVERKKWLLRHEQTVAGGSVLPFAN